MPDDLLRYLIAPEAGPARWLWPVLTVSLLISGWYAAVLLVAGARGTAVRHTVRGSLLRRKFAGAVHAVGRRYRAGDLDRREAAAAISSCLRDFLQRHTGERAHHLHLGDLDGSALAPAAPVLTDLTDARFNAGSTVDVGAVADDAEELIRSWP